MRIEYLDTSAWVKQFLTEDGSDAMASLWEGADALATCELTRVEMHAAFTRARGTRLVEADWPALRRSFLTAWEEVTVVRVDPGLLDRACYFAETYRLRGYDAVHLAAALSLRPAVRLVANDGDLLKAGRHAGIPNLDPASGSS